VTIQRIYLTTNGQKADVPSPKKAMPTTAPVLGAAVRLDRPGETLCVTEGIETGLAVRCCLGLPTWAAVSAGGLERLHVPGVVHLVLICADNDASGTGERAAKTLARRILLAGQRVKIVIPETIGADWADGMQEGEHG
jgi:putative DNA primase/helicase